MGVWTYIGLLFRVWDYIEEGATGFGQSLNFIILLLIAYPSLFVLSMIFN